MIQPIIFIQSGLLEKEEFQQLSKDSRIRYGFQNKFMFFRSAYLDELCDEYEFLENYLIDMESRAVRYINEVILDFSDDNSSGYDCLEISSKDIAKELLGIFQNPNIVDCLFTCPSIESQIHQYEAEVISKLNTNKLKSMLIQLNKNKKFNVNWEEIKILF